MIRTRVLECLEHTCAESTSCLYLLFLSFQIHSFDKYFSCVSRKPNTSGSYGFALVGLTFPKGEPDEEPVDKLMYNVMSCGRLKEV